MNSTTNDFDVEKLPWSEILANFYEQYDEILERHLKSYSRYYKAIFELLRYTQIEVQYDPELVNVNESPMNQEGITFWNELSAEVTTELQKILVQKYNVPEKYANAIQVGNIGVIFLSTVASRNQCCSEPHTCSNGRIRYVCCPC